MNIESHRKKTPKKRAKMAEKSACGSSLAGPRRRRQPMNRPRFVRHFSFLGLIMAPKNIRPTAAKWSTINGIYRAVRLEPPSPVATVHAIAVALITYLIAKN
jgi:hypothetical protein